MNKAEYIALINSNLPDGSQIPSSSHRETMHTNESSVAEMVYKDSITDYSESSPLITTPNAAFTYYATFNKVGNKITITGSFTNSITVGANASIFEISDTDYDCISERFHSIAIKANSPDTLAIYMTGNTLKVGVAIMAGETFNYTITYTAIN